MQLNSIKLHFSDLYGTERPYTALAIDKVPPMEIIEELDGEPQLTEMEAVVARLSNNKASGMSQPKRCDSCRSDQGWQTSIVITTLH